MSFSGAAACGVGLYMLGFAPSCSVMDVVLELPIPWSMLLLECSCSPMLRLAACGSWIRAGNQPSRLKCDGFVAPSV
ncbi:hypothetical protein Nepgr_005263 [Nepenthes gracilis]|uniref:Uncharacterized protein n=1 Tax=Nepenthes gracilis TaxID=150966 RepID=A0AAD3S2V0_NEPGR|nr:hypothetical protein Nepgr_005263 [Nepenthes gracilis]